MLKEIGKEALKPLSYAFRESEPILSWCWGNTSGTFRHTVSVLYRLFDPKWGDDLQNEHRVWKKTWILRLKHKLLRNLLTDVINQESFLRDFYRNWLLLTSTESPPLLVISDTRATTSSSIYIDLFSEVCVRWWTWLRRRSQPLSVDHTTLQRPPTYNLSRDVMTVCILWKPAWVAAQRSFHSLLYTHMHIFITTWVL